MAAMAMTAPTSDIESSLRHVGKLLEVSDEQIYFQAQVHNSSSAGDQVSGDPPIAYNDTRNLPIIRDASKWKMAIVRATIDSGSDIPVFMAQIRGGITQTDPNLMVESVSMTFAWHGATAAYTDVTVDGTNGTFVVTAYDTASPSAPINGAGTIVVLPPGIYTRAAYAVVVQAALVAIGGVFALCTATVTPSGRLQITPGATTGVLVGIDFATTLIGTVLRDTSAAVIGGVVGTQVQASLTNPAIGFVLPNAITNPATAGIVVSPTFHVTVPLIWVPQDKTEVDVPLAPSANGGKQQTWNAYYYFAWDERWIAGLFNTAFATCITQAATGLLAQFQAWWTASAFGLPFPGIRTQAPFMSFSGASSLFTLALDKFGFATAEQTQTSYGLTWPLATEQLTCIFNSAAYKLFRSFPSIRLLAVAGQLEERWQIVPQGSLVSGTLPNGTACWLVEQAWASTDGQWSPVTDIVFTTSSLPVQATQVGSVVDFDGSTLTVSNSSSGFVSVITDISLSGQPASSYRGGIQYTPQSEYRYVSMGTASAPIYSVQISVWWKTRWGELVSVTLPQNGFAEVLIQFKRIAPDVDVML